MRKYTVFFLLITFKVALSQNINRPFPEDFFSYEFVEEDTSFNQSILTSVLFLNPRNGMFKNGLVILDSNGYIQWYNSDLALGFNPQVDFKYFPDHQVFSYAKADYFRILDTNFTLIDSIKPINGFVVDIHDFEIMPNGNYVLAGISDSVVDLSTDTFAGIPGSDTTHLMGFTIQEFDANKNLLFEWDSNNEVDPREAYADFYGYDPSKFDYCHGNSIKKDLDSNYLVSFRHTNSVMKIDKNTGKIIWRLGGKNSDFTFVNDSGFSGQHDFQVQPNGNYTLFDNSNMSQPRKASRAVEYQLDTVNNTATKVWEYIHSPVITSNAMGNYQRKLSGIQTIGYGLVYRPESSAIFLDASDSLMASLSFFDTTVCYRVFAEQLNFNIDRPQVNCVKQSGGVSLSAPLGFSNYKWSTGDTSNTILVNQAGVYQVWVSKGIGMLGSEPIVIDSMLTCGSVTSLVEISNRNTGEKKVYKIYDLIGREVNKPKIGAIYIIRYTNGSSEKLIWKRRN